MYLLKSQYVTGPRLYLGLPAYSNSDEFPSRFVLLCSASWYRTMSYFGYKEGDNLVNNSLTVIVHTVVAAIT